MVRIGCPGVHEPNFLSNAYAEIVKMRVPSINGVAVKIAACTRGQRTPRTLDVRRSSSLGDDSRGKQRTY